MLSKIQIRNYAYNLVVEGKVCYSQLNTIERNKLAGLLIENTRLINAYECISDADIKTELPYMLGKFMETGDVNIGEEILVFLQENAARSMAKEIDELLAGQEIEFKFEQGDGA